MNDEHNFPFAACHPVSCYIGFHNLATRGDAIPTCVESIFEWRLVYL